MTRRHLTFACAGETLVGTLDEGDRPVGLLLVSGGNEVRSGAFGSQATLARDIAAQGFAVFRFDRRGIGDSTGTNTGFRGSADDLAAAMGAFRAHCPHVQRLVGFGNCDAASALMLTGGAGCAALVLSNPWTFEDEADETMPATAIRQRYAERLKDPREIWRLLSGRVNLAKLLRGLRQALSPPPAPTTLARSMADGLAGFSGPCAILLAERDRTAQAFLTAWDQDDPRLRIRPGADHAFSRKEDGAWLLEQLLATLHEQANQFDMR